MASDVLKAPRKLFRTPAGVIGVVCPLGPRTKPYLFTIRGVAIHRLAVLNSLEDAERLVVVLGSALPEVLLDPKATEAYIQEAMVHPV